MPQKFVIVMRGYDRQQVDELISLVDEALASAQEPVRASAIAALRSAQLAQKFRGYSRLQVDNYLEHQLLELSRPAH